MRRGTYIGGFSLLELMITVAIVGLLAAIAYPSYSAYVVRANRSAAKSALLQVADRQEQFFADNKRYAANLTALGYGADEIMIDDQVATVAAGDPARIYQIRLTNTSATTFTANAVPQLQQAARDVACGTLSLTHVGLRSPGGGSNCW